MEPAFRNFPTASYGDNWGISPFTGFNMDMNSMMPFQGGLQGGLNDVTKPMVPLMSADLVESDKDFNVHVDLPGVSDQDLDISIQDRTLVIKAERKIVNEEDNDRVHRRERQYGKVQRRIMLPINADMDNAQVQFTNGVLNVTFPKKEGASSGIKKLEIK
jgi:HSP20 family protein